MNLLPATLHDDGSLHVRLGQAELAVPAPLAQRLNGNGRAGREVLLGIRPEDIVPAADGQLAGEVDLVEPLGRDDMLIVRAGEIQIHALAPASSGYETGAPVQLKLNTERLHFFDPETEQSLLWT